MSAGNRLRRGHIKAGDPRVSVAHREFRDFERPGRGTHRSEQCPDHYGTAGRTRLGHADREAGEHCLHNSFEMQALFGVELGGETDLRVHDPVLRKVFHAFACHPLESFCCLHDRNRMCEALEVADEVPARRLGDEPSSERRRVVRRQVLVPAGGGELYDSSGTQAAVEVVVEKDLGGAADLLEARGSVLHRPHAA